MSSDLDERLARAALSRALEPGIQAVGEALDRHGAVELWRRLRAGDPLVAPAVARGAAARLPDVAPERDLERLDRVGGRLLVPGDEEWPACLGDLGTAAPMALWVRGPLHLDAATRRSVAVVGSRSASAYGGHVASQLSAELADAGWGTTSGGAYGVDGAAHRGCLAAGGETVAVLACGVDVPYPRGHDLLFSRVVEEGLLVSEWPPGSAPHRLRFLVRNRVIAALTAGTVVVEAAARSGALSTARFALRLGRRVMAVPGPVTSATSTGCHALLREHDEVRLVVRAAHVIEEVGRIGADLTPPERGPVSEVDRLAPDVRAVYDAMPVRTGVGPATLAARGGVELAVVLRSLGPLQVAGLARQDGGGWVKAPGPRRSRSAAAPPPAQGDPRAAQPDTPTPPVA